jgi:hypothetical protein
MAELTDLPLAYKAYSGIGGGPASFGFRMDRNFNIIAFSYLYTDNGNSFDGAYIYTYNLNYSSTEDFRNLGYDANAGYKMWRVVGLRGVVAA